MKNRGGNGKTTCAEEKMKTVNGKYTGKNFCKGKVFDYSVAIPESDGPTALCFTHDGLNDSIVKVTEALVERGFAPVCTYIGVTPGVFPERDGTDYAVRQQNYDLFDREYSDFVVLEIIPYLISEYGLSISEKPDLHLICGCSSGGNRALCDAWFHPEFFHLIYLSSPAVASMSGGDGLVAQMRLFETRPFRIFVEYSEEEPDESFGSLYAADVTLVRTLAFAGYDFRSAYLPGEWHGSRYSNTESLYSVLSWLWEFHSSKPITPPRNTYSLDKLFKFGTGWEKTGRTRMPSQKNNVNGIGEYYVSGNAIWLKMPGGEREKVAEGFKRLTSVAVSVDGKRLYAADSQKPCLLTFTIMSDGTLAPPYVSGCLHMKKIPDVPGAVSLCTSSDTMTFALTELGIQCADAYGLIRGILDLPSEGATEIAFGGRKNEYLLVRCADGIYQRKMLVKGR